MPPLEAGIVQEMSYLGGTCRRTASPISGTLRDGPFLRELPMPWGLLVIAGILEIVWAAAMKQSAGFSRPIPTLIMIAAMPASFALLAMAMKTLPLGTAYMVWTGIGAAGAFIFGVIWLGEAATPMRLAAAAMIAGGIVLMKLAN